jgi:hypothetical protein
LEQEAVVDLLGTPLLMFHPQAVWLKVHMILQRALQLAFG